MSDYLKMILIVTNSEDKTVDYFLNSASKKHFRFNTDYFLNDYDFNFSQKWYIHNKKNGLLLNQRKISGIYYRRPVLPKLEIENIDDDLLRQLQNEAYDIYDSFLNSIDTKYLNSKYNMIKAENKLIQLKAAENIGFLIPKTIITNDKRKLYQYINQDKKYCIKPLHLGFFELNGNSFIPYTAIIEKSDYNMIINYPVLIQEYIEKEYELRLTCVGNKIFPVKILSQLNENTRIDWRTNNRSAVEYDKISIREELENMCHNLLYRFGLNFACMDLIVGKNGKIYFLDLNPNGQWAWIDELLDLGITKEIEEYFCE
jgi:glutathione synthase/RimK-type ligase-like ATP-grasp enzyme